MAQTNKTDVTFGVVNILNYENVNNRRITNVSTPINSTDAANKAYVDQLISSSDLIAGTGITLGNGIISVSSYQPQITAIGTIQIGTWNANPIQLNYGGTGTTSFSTNKLLFYNGSNSLNSATTLNYDSNYLVSSTPIFISNTQDTLNTNNSIGALSIAGGVTISKSLYVNGNTLLNGNLNAENVTLQNLIVNGSTIIESINSFNGDFSNSISTGSFYSNYIFSNNEITSPLIINTNLVSINSTITNLIASSVSSSTLNTNNISSGSIITTSITSSIGNISQISTGILYAPKISSSTLNITSISTGSLISSIYISTPNVITTNITTTNINTANISASSLQAISINNSNANIINSTITNILNSNITTVSLNTTNISSVNLIVTNISNSVISTGNAYISNNLSASSITTNNLSLNNITASSINAIAISSSTLNISGNTSLTNVIFTNSTAGSVYINNYLTSTFAHFTGATTQNLNVTNSAIIPNINSVNLTTSFANCISATIANISSTLIKSINFVATNISTVSLITTNLNTSYLNTSSITTGNLVVNQISILGTLGSVNISTGLLYISNNAYIPNSILTNASTSSFNAINEIVLNSSIANAKINFGSIGNLSANNSTISNLINVNGTIANVYITGNANFSKNIVLASNYLGTPTNSAGSFFSILPTNFTDTFTVSGGNLNAWYANYISSPTLIGQYPNITTNQAINLFIEGNVIPGTNETFIHNSALTIGYINNTSSGSFNSQISLTRADGNAYAGFYVENATNKLVIANGSLEGGGGVGIYTVTGSGLTLNNIASALDMTPTPFIQFLNTSSQIYSTLDSSNGSTGSLVLFGGLGVSKTIYATTINATFSTISNLNTANFNTQNFGASNANINNLTVSNLHVNNEIVTNSTIVNAVCSFSIINGASISNLNTTNAISTNLVVTNETISSLITLNGTIVNSSITNALITTSSITNLHITNSSVSNIQIGNEIVNSSLITNLTTSNLNVIGNATIGGNLFVVGTITSVNITSINLIDTNISANSLDTTLISAANLFSNIGTISVLNVVGTQQSLNSTIGALNVNGGVSINSLHNATSNTQGGALTIAGGTAIAGDLYVGGTIHYNALGTGSNTFEYLTLTANDVSNNIANGALVSYGGISIQNATDATSATAGNGLTVAGGVGIGQSLYVGTIINVPNINVSNAISTGDLLISGNISAGNDLLISGNISAGNDLLISGNVSIGNSLSVIGGATFGASIIPNTNISYDLGSSTNRWRTIYLSGSTIDLGGTLISATNGTIQFGTTILATSTGGNTSSSIPNLISSLINTSNLITTNSTILNLITTNISVASIINTNLSSTNISAGILNIIGVTTGDINFTGNLYQNGIIYISSQWNGSVGSAISYTGGNVNINNFTTINSTISSIIITGTSGSSNSTTGTLILENGGLSINSNFNSTSNTEGGALTVAGGTAISGDLYVGGTIYYNSLGVGSNTFNYLTLTATDPADTISDGALVSYGGISIQLQTDATSPTSGNGLTVAGGVGIGQSLYVGNVIYTPIINVTNGNITSTNITSANILNETVSNTLVTNETITNSLITNLSTTFFTGGYSIVTGLTTGDLNFTGNLYQNGSLYISSQWISDGSDISFTSGNASIANLLVNSGNFSFGTVNNLVTTNFTGGYSVVTGLTTGDLNFTGNIYKNGSIYQSSQWVNDINGDISFTSGNTSISNLLVTNISVGILNTTNITVSNINFTGNLYQNGILYSTPTSTGGGNSQWSNTLGNAITYTMGNIAVVGINIGNSIIGSAVFSAQNGISNNELITNLIFTGIRSFTMVMSVSLLQIIGGNLFSQYTFNGIQTDAGWYMNVGSIGDTINLTFTIDSFGQIYYSCGTNYINFTSMIFNYNFTALL